MVGDMRQHVTQPGFGVDIRTDFEATAENIHNHGQRFFASISWRPDVQVQAVLTESVVSLKPLGVARLQRRRSFPVLGPVRIERQQDRPSEAFRPRVRYA